MIVTVTLPAEMATWRPTVFPGQTSTEPNCTCPAAQPLWPGALTFEDTCPVHTDAIRNGWQTIQRATP